MESYKKKLIFDEEFEPPYRCFAYRWPLSQQNRGFVGLSYCDVVFGKKLTAEEIDLAERLPHLPQVLQSPHSAAPIFLFVSMSFLLQLFVLT